MSQPVGNSDKFDKKTPGQVERELPFFNLDMILSLGYRIRSATATHFRRWALERLKEVSHLLVGGPEEFCGVVAAALGFGEDFFFCFGGDLRGAGENPQVIVAAAAD